MQITCKTLTAEIFKLEAKPSDTVKQLKQYIQVSKGYPIEIQHLSSSGRILKDEQRVAEFITDDSKFLFVIVPFWRKSECSEKRGKEITKSSGLIQQDLANTIGNESNQSNEENVKNLVAMGFELSEVKAALLASNNRQELAIECLLNGPPPKQPPPQPQESDKQAVVWSSQLWFDFPEDSDRFTDDHKRLFECVLEDTTVKPLVPEMRKNREALDDLLKRINNENPDLARVIEIHKSRFLEMINEPDKTGGK